MRNFPKRPNQLDPNAVAARTQKLLDDKRPIGCINCGGTVFVQAFELKLINALEVGAPADVVATDNGRFCCLACLKPWLKGETKDGEDNDPQEGSLPDDGGEG